MFRFLVKLFLPRCSEQGYRTVRFTFSFVFFAVLFAGMASVISQNESYITIEPSHDTVAKEQSFTIDVKAYAHVPINAVDIVLTYPEDAMVIDSIDTGTSVISLWTKDPYAENGNIYIQGGTFRKGFIGEHTIVRIKAHAITAGEARFLVKNTQLIAGDGSGTEVSLGEASADSLRITVTGSEDGVLLATAEVAVVTDTDGDGDVDLGDVSKFMSAWLTRGKTYDFNSDGKMTFKDFSILLAETFLN